MKVYNVLWKDGHNDTTAKPFVNLDDAIKYARIKAAEFSRRFPEDYKETHINGWLFHVEYSCEGDCLWVTKHDL